MAVKIPLTFKIYKGDQLEREETLQTEVPGVVKIGKLESSHLRIEDDDVSRMHAVIELADPSEISIIDLGSANGTVVNGAKVSKAKISDGDELTLGATRVVVSIGAAVDEATAFASSPSAPPPPGMVPPVGGPVAPMGMGGVVSPGGLVAPPGMGPPPVARAAAQAFVPTADPTLDRQDGSRAIEITALFEDTVVEVRHLDNPKAGNVSGLTWAVLVVGWGTFLFGLVLATLLSQRGLGGFLAALGVGVGVWGLNRFFLEKVSPDYILGESVDADLNVMHAAIPASRFPLIESTGQDYQLNYTKEMKGDVTIGADRQELPALVNSGLARPGGVGGAFAYPIPQDARIKLDFGDHTFLINSVAPARRVIAPFLTSVNWSAQVSNGLSFAAHALLLFLVFAIPPDAKALSLDLFNTDNKFVKYLVKPPEQKEEEVPEWLKKKGPDKAGGKGQKHKGEEGKMGKKTSKKKTGLYGLKGPKNNPDPHMAKRLAEDAAKNAGVLGLLKSSSGSHLASIFGRDSALGTDAEDALGGLIGDQIGESYGLGGLGLAGTGRGGGGTGEGTIGLGTLGTIGKGGGGGNGAGYGRGAGRLGGRRARAPRVIAGRAQVRGALDKEIIRRIIRRHINEVKYCYQKELQGNAKLGGRVIIQFMITATGQVGTSKVQQSTVKNRKVEVCIAQAVRRWLFPKPKGGGIVIVSYPFVLRSAGG
ncbi:MAG: AgmX/PglI C-terminal domain-containing protein [Deltaproteobacteria bacterium]|nr:AgmX/PglI C-terminal domain-containing protein [Deltaproteobacteria bacterium]